MDPQSIYTLLRLCCISPVRLQERVCQFTPPRAYHMCLVSLYLKPVCRKWKKSMESAGHHFINVLGGKEKLSVWLFSQIRPEQSRFGEFSDGRYRSRRWKLLTFLIKMEIIQEKNKNTQELVYKLELSIQILGSRKDLDLQKQFIWNRHFINKHFFNIQNTLIFSQSMKLECFSEIV